MHQFRKTISQLPFASLIFPIIIVSLFFILYTILGVVRHNFYGSFGADLGFIDNLFWRYSNFDYSELIGGSHIEPTSLLIAPLYWLWTDPRILIIFQAFAITFSGVAVFLLAKKKKLHIALCYGVLLSYLSFYGVQSAIWFDVHTSVWGAAAFIWFIYFLDNGNRRASIITFLLTIGAKENMAVYVFLFCIIYFIVTRKKEALLFAGGAAVYSFILFKIVFPATLPKGYSYSSSQGLLTGSPLELFDSIKKRETLFYTFAWVGFIPLLMPLFMLPILGNLGSYFILGREYVAAHEIFMHYRVDLVPLLFAATIFTLAKYKWLNNRYVAVYLLLCLFVFQYTLHLPLSYLTKKWFWSEPSGVPGINSLIKDIPNKARLVAQNNIYPHVSQREHIELLWPDQRSFSDTSICGKTSCPWLRWESPSEYLIVDLSSEWDIRHLLHQNAEFREAVTGMEKEGVIKLIKQVDNARLYSIEKAAK